MSLLSRISKKCGAKSRDGNAQRRQGQHLKNMTVERATRRSERPQKLLSNMDISTNTIAKRPSHEMMQNVAGEAECLKDSRNGTSHTHTSEGIRGIFNEFANIGSESNSDNSSCSLIHTDPEKIPDGPHPILYRGISAETNSKKTAAMISQADLEALHAEKEKLKYQLSNRQINASFFRQRMRSISMDFDVRYSENVDRIRARILETGRASIASKEELALHGRRVLRLSLTEGLRDTC